MRSEEISPKDPSQPLKENYLSVTNQIMPSISFWLLLPLSTKFFNFV